MATGYNEKAYEDLEKKDEHTYQPLTRTEKENEYELDHQDNAAAAYQNGVPPRYDSVAFNRKTDSDYYNEPYYEKTGGSNNNDDPYFNPISSIKNKDIQPSNVPYYSTPPLENQISPYSDSHHGLENPYYSDPPPVESGYLKENGINSRKAAAIGSGYEVERQSDYYNQPTEGKAAVKGSGYERERDSDYYNQPPEVNEVRYNVTPPTAPIMSNKSSVTYSKANPQAVTIRGSNDKPAAGNSISRASAYSMNQESEYSDIPADHFSDHGSQASLRSTSSVTPILQQDSKEANSCFTGRRRLAVILLLVLAVVVIIIIAVAVAVSVSGKGSTAEEVFQGPHISTSTITSTKQLSITISTPTPTTTLLTPTSMPQLQTTPTEHTTTTQLPTTTQLSTTTSTTTTRLTTTTPTPTSTTSMPLSSANSTLVMLDHPKETAAVVGDTVTLCCQASGQPPPQHFDWFKDGLLLPQHTQVSSTWSTITLANVQISQAGLYTCRASNSYTYIMSAEAKVDVRATNSFCSSTPETWEITLPTGCTHNGNSELDRGHCPARLCSGGGEVGCLAADTKPYCCGPVQVSTTAIECDGTPLNINTVSECGCVQCDVPYYDIAGVIQSADGLTQFANGHVYLEDYQSDNDDRADDKGIFHLTVRNNTRRLLLITDNVYDREAFYTRSSHVLHLPPANTGIVYTMTDVRFIARTSITSHSTSADVTISTSFPDGTQFITLQIPGGNHFYMQNGTRYSGSYSLSVDAIRGDDMTSLRAAPGDFVYVGTDGIENYLITHGLFAIEMDSNQGLLHYGTTFTMTVQSEVLAADNSAQLWRLGKSGFWHIEDDLNPLGNRKKRKRRSFPTYQSTLHGIENGYAWFAIASRVDFSVCVTKVRIFHGDTTKADSQLTGAQIEINMKDSGGYTGGIYTTRASTDRADINGYCVEHPCHSSLSGAIIATYDNQNLIPVTTPNNGPVVSFTPQIQRGSTGPTYLKDESQVCSDADIEQHSYIAFKKHSCSKMLNSVMNLNTLSSADSSCIVDYYRSWHSPQEYINQEFTSCHIKVITGATGINTAFAAISYVGDLTQIGGHFSSTQMYGLREECMVDVNNVGVACLEIKTGGTRNCNGNPVNEVTDEMAEIVIYPLTGTLSVSEIDVTLRSTSNTEILLEDSQFRFKAKKSDYSRSHGIYCSDGSSPESAAWKSKRLCLSGQISQSQAGAVTSSYYGVKFD